VFYSRVIFSRSKTDAFCVAEGAHIDRFARKSCHSSATLADNPTCWQITIFCTYVSLNEV
jgi:hypothetical protein